MSSAENINTAEKHEENSEGKPAETKWDKLEEMAAQQEAAIETGDEDWYPEWDEEEPDWGEEDEPGRTIEDLDYELYEFQKTAKIKDTDKFIETGVPEEGDDPEDVAKLTALVDEVIELSIATARRRDDGYVDVLSISTAGECMGGKYREEMVGNLSVGEISDFYARIANEGLEPGMELTDDLRNALGWTFVLRDFKYTEDDVRGLDAMLEERGEESVVERARAVQTYLTEIAFGQLGDEEVMGKLDNFNQQALAKLVCQYIPEERILDSPEAMGMMQKTMRATLEAFQNGMEEERKAGPGAYIPSLSFDKPIKTSFYGSDSAYGDLYLISRPMLEALKDLPEEERPQEALVYMTEKMVLSTTLGTEEEQAKTLAGAEWMEDEMGIRPMRDGDEQFRLEVGKNAKLQQGLIKHDLMNEEEIGDFWHTVKETVLTGNEAETQAFDMRTLGEAMTPPTEDDPAANFWARNYAELNQLANGRYGEHLSQEEVRGMLTEDGLPTDEFLKKILEEVKLDDSQDGGMYGVYRRLFERNSEMFKAVKPEVWAKFFEDEYSSGERQDQILDVMLREGANPISGMGKEFRNFVATEVEGPEGEMVPRYETMSEEAIEMSVEVLTRLFESNSAQLSRLATQLAGEVLKDPETAAEKVERLEHVFTRRNIPDFAKLYCCANVLYEGKIDSEWDVSPVLQGAEDKRNVLMTDLLKNAIRSNNRSLRVYLERAIQGAQLDSTDDLDEDSEGLLADFESGKKFRTRFLGFARNLGLNTMQDVLAAMDESREQRHQAHLDMVEKTDGEWRLTYKIQPGDFIKGINVQYIDSMMRDGFNCPEMIGEAATQDSTHWDTDCGSAKPVGVADSEGFVRQTDDIEGAIMTSLANGYGHGFHVVMRNDERFSHTVPGDASEYAGFTTYEAYHARAHDETFRGIRTGFGSQDVDFFVVSDPMSLEVGKMQQEIAKNGCYIPIVDRKTERVIFSPDDYAKLRQQMSGMERYQTGQYEFAESLTLLDELGHDKFSELVERYDDKESETRAMQTMVTAHLLVAIERSGLPEEVKKAFRNYNRTVSEDARPGTVDALSTGSTGRYTNKPGDADFDFVWRMDRTIKQQYGARIIDVLTHGHEGNPAVISRFAEGSASGVIDGAIRKGLVDIEVAGTPMTVEVDISPVIKTDKLQFSSEQALEQRFAAIREQDPERYRQVIANIVVAKQVLKDKGVYKKREEHGLGGIGVENWILQHGGSLMAAAQAFLAAARRDGGGYVDFGEFRSRYTVYDLGENHLSKGYPYDNFVDHFTAGEDGSYRRMIEVCEELTGE